MRHGAEWLQLWAHPDDDLSDLERAQKRQRLQAFDRGRRALENLARPLAANPNHAHALAHARPDWARQTWAVAKGDLARAAFMDRHGIGLSGLAHQLDMARATAFGLRCYPGMFASVQAMAQSELEASGSGNAFLAAQLPLDRALFLVFADRWGAMPEPLFDSGAVDMWAGWFLRRYEREVLRMDAKLHDSLGFAGAVSAFLGAVSTSLTIEQRRRAPDGQDAPKDGGHGNQDEEIRSLAQQAFHEAMAGAGERDEDEERADQEGSTAAPMQPYTTDFDQELPLASLISAEQAERHNLRLSHAYAEQSAEARRLSRALSLALRAKRQSAWTFDREEGLIDASRLAQVIAAPQKRRLFKQEIDAQDLDAAVAMLMDCSGSMRGKWMDLTVLAVRALGDALNLANITFEVLGFTTASKRGGKTFAAWKAAGSPPAPPGTNWRLNDVRHLVLKPFGQPWRQPRKALPALCEGTLLNENIDHEALAWAATRLRAMPQQRKLLIVLSDGAPSCGTTERFSGNEALSKALKSTLNTLGDLEICALGIRHDVGGFYPNKVLIQRHSEIVPSLFELMAKRILIQTER